MVSTVLLPLANASNFVSSLLKFNTGLTSRGNNYTTCLLSFLILGKIQDGGQDGDHCW